MPGNDCGYYKSIRLPFYDYAGAGYYFVTICADFGESLFGEIVAEEMRLSRDGHVVEKKWHEIPLHFTGVDIDAFVVMPNHVHGIIVIKDLEDSVPSVVEQHAVPLRKRRGPKAGSLGVIVRSFKSAVTREINLQRGTPGVTVWQRNYYEHVIRDERDLERIREYIENNPLRWALDEENPENRIALTPNP